MLAALHDQSKLPSAFTWLFSRWPVPVVSGYCLCHILNQYSPTSPLRGRNCVSHRCSISYKPWRFPKSNQVLVPLKTVEPVSWNWGRSVAMRRR